MAQCNEIPPIKSDPFVCCHGYRLTDDFLKQRRDWYASKQLFELAAEDRDELIRRDAERDNVTCAGIKAVRSRR